MYPDLSDAVWRKSVRSGGEGGNCVEVAVTEKVTGVRDSKNASGAVLVFRASAAEAFLAAVRNGRLEL